MSLEVTGAEQLAELAKRLREAGDKDLKRELSRAITQAVKPLIKETRAEALRRLPKKGGLNQRVAKSKIRTVRRTTGASQGIRLTTQGGRGENAGVVRHPVFGSRKTFVTQRVKSGWWSDPLAAGSHDVQVEISAAMRRVAEKLTDG